MNIMELIEQMSSHEFSLLSDETLSAIEKTNPLKIEDGTRNGGPRYVVDYPNGYSASIIKHCASYGGTDDLWELAVLKNGGVCYDTPITDDVIGWLSEEEVVELCRQISEL